MSSSVDAELIKLIDNVSLKVDTRRQGWDHVLGLTATEAGINHIIKSDVYIPFILSSISKKGIKRRSGKNTTENEFINLAYKCLINISNNELGASAMLKVKEDFPRYLLYNICDQKEKFIQAKCYILSNIVAHRSLTEQVANVLISIPGLLENLMKGYCSSDSSLRSQYDFLTLVFANVSKLSTARRFFLEHSSFLTRILTFTNTCEPDVRRLGAALILRNCCLDTEYHEKLLNEMAILPVVLLPLMDSKEFEESELEKLPVECQYLDESKVREENPTVRRILVQILIVLCYSETGWNYLKSHGTYCIARDLHTSETNEAVLDAIEHLVTYLLVEEYSKAKDIESYNTEEELLISQLESDIARDIPDFVV